MSDVQDTDIREWIAERMFIDALSRIDESSKPERSLWPQALVQQELGLIGPTIPFETITDERAPIDIATVDIDEGPIPIDRLLGEYLPERRAIRIYKTEIELVARSLKCEDHILQTEVRLHEYGHAFVHLGLELVDSNRLPHAGRGPVIEELGDWVEFIASRSRLFGSIQETTHELLAQTAAWCLLQGCERERDVMLRLTVKQSELYRLSEAILNNATLAGLRSLLGLIWRGKIGSDETDFDRRVRAVLELQDFPNCAGAPN
jgi:hypothetical protein